VPGESIPLAGQRSALSKWGIVGAVSLWKSSQADKTATVIWKILQMVLWLVAGSFSKMLIEYREHFAAGRGAPAEFAPLWEWAQTHGIFPQTK
jgi:hypothetical protein